MVGFAWGEGAGGFLDAKSAPWVAVLPAGATEVESMELASAMDDYIEARTFATPSGLVMTYCNTDDTGFLADESRSGVSCHVLTRTGARDWSAFDGYPSSFENLDHDFAFVGGHVATIHRVRGGGGHVYAAGADATPSPIVTDANEISFVRGDGAAPVLFVTSSDAAIVARPR